MTYIKTNWKDQKVERPHTYEANANSDGTITLVDSFGNVEQIGTPVNAENMNKIENGIAGVAIRLHNMTEVFAKDEWVKDKDKLFKSKQDQNKGHATSENDWWEEVFFKDNSKADVNLSNISKAGKEVISNLPMPSDKYIDLPLSNQDPAPADGYYTILRRASGPNQYLGLTNSASDIGFQVVSNFYDDAYHLTIPAKKGDLIAVNNSFGGQLYHYRFVYAQGEI